ncbi:Ltp family lipoprotein [Tessaracoccus sp. OS52]|uniref:Ltp family lipoprotein n=1 Tax=Tessaracoccus sp. OS52 TaxID=2886691 RepID=UPI001D11387F|nr:Ltp family lipoprotein [Tessaracoccus sp. OS52]MCC2592444.1 Ltp family lipoprotein [Tessaracoccus sp. OS52]
MRSIRTTAIALFAICTVGVFPVLSAAPAAAEVDVYTTPGTHQVNGRQWRTTCAPYSSSIERCRTEIWASVIHLSQAGRFTQVNGWAFNNLTYKPVSYPLWGTNPLARPGTWTKDGRQWRTECGTPATGRDACRSYIYSTVYARTTTGYTALNQWTFNNITRFTPGTAAYPAPSTTPAPTPTKPVTVSQQQAVRSAEEYLAVLSFSRIGLIEQLEYEGFSNADSVFAVDYLRVDWYAQAARSAREYLNFMAFSRIGLIDQLLYEGFTHEQAIFGVNSVGL